MFKHHKPKPIFVLLQQEVLSCMQREDAAQLIKDYIPHSGSDTAQSRSAVENTCHFKLSKAGQEEGAF
jgi:hypothetical protein